MSLFKYEALDERGHTIRGLTDAGTAAEARAGLRDQGYHATRLNPAAGGNGQAASPRPTASLGLAPFWRKLSGHRLDLLSFFSRHLSMLLRSGLPLAQSLAVLSDQSEDRSFKEVIADLAVRVREGASLDEALAVHPGYFTPVFICMARSGTASGNLAQVLSDLASFYARQKRLRDKVVSALTYPLLMSSIGLVVLVFLLAFVVPKVTTVLLEQEKALPWPTQVLLWVSSVFQDGWFALILGALFLGWASSVVLRTERGKRAWDRLLLSIPVLKTLLRKDAVARWADTMSNLLSSGIPLTQALSIVKETLGNRVLMAEVAKFEKRVTEGSDLSDVLKESREFPKSLGFVVGVGEESGELSKVLREVAQGYHEEVEVVASRLADLVNPVLIVFLGVVVAFIVAAILLPITDFANIKI